MSLTCVARPACSPCGSISYRCWLLAPSEEYSRLTYGDVGSSSSPGTLWLSVVLFKETWYPWVVQKTVPCFNIKLVPHSSLLLSRSHFELMDSWVDPSLLAEAKLREDGLSAALRPAVAEGGYATFGFHTSFTVLSF